MLDEPAPIPVVDEVGLIRAAEGKPRDGGAGALFYAEPDNAIVDKLEVICSGGRADDEHVGNEQEDVEIHLH